MSSLNQKAKGSITAEYAVVIIMLMIPLWYGLMGGSGSWFDTRRAPNHGNLTQSPPADDPAPGLFQALDQRQQTFTRSLSQP